MNTWSIGTQKFGKASGKSARTRRTRPTNPANRRVVSHPADCGKPPRKLLLSHPAICGRKNLQLNPHLNPNRTGATPKPRLPIGGTCIRGRLRGGRRWTCTSGPFAKDSQPPRSCSRQLSAPGASGPTSLLLAQEVLCALERGSDHAVTEAAWTSDFCAILSAPRARGKLIQRCSPDVLGRTRGMPPCPPPE